MAAGEQPGAFGTSTALAWLPACVPASLSADRPRRLICAPDPATPGPTEAEPRP